jgi:Kef-type K+ transport system membrane component KefB
LAAARAAPLAATLHAASMNSNSRVLGSNARPASPWRLGAGYSAMVAATVGLFMVIQSFGQRLETAVGPSASPTAVAAPKGDVLFHVLVALVAILLAGRWLGKLCLHIGQPRVIGEIVAGILLGPSLLGRVWPEAMQFVLPTMPPNDIRGSLGIIAQIGVILYMFLVGLELNAGLIRHHAHAAVAISHASILAPFILGSSLALALFRELAPAGVPFTSFALFMGIATSITAFPVLARILTDRKMEKTPLGVMALSCAATDDATAWCLLAFVVGVTQAKLGGAFWTTLMALAYIAFMVAVVRPLAVRFLGGDAQKLPKSRLAVWVLVALLLSAATAEAIGIHAIFGAFLLGAVIPHDSEVARDFRHKLEDIVKILLLPAFFAYTGMRTEISLVAGWQDWLITAAIILVATVGKFGGTLAAARFTGLDWRTSSALGILMNTRGLMELVVLNVGLDMGVISPKLFAMMVIMAVATTFATTPILMWLTKGRPDLCGVQHARARV